MPKDKEHVVFRACGAGADEQWTLRPDGSIHPAVDEDKCLDLPAWSVANHLPVELYECNRGANQLWSYEPDNTIRGLYGKCLNRPSGNPNPAELEYYDCNGGSAQRFLAQP
jgi:hypothetical protein